MLRNIPGVPETDKTNKRPGRVVPIVFIMRQGEGVKLRVGTKTESGNIPVMQPRTEGIEVGKKIAQF